MVLAKVNVMTDQRQEMMVILPSHHSTRLEHKAFEVAFSSVRDEYAVSLQDGSFVVQNETGRLALISLARKTDVLTQKLGNCIWL